MFKKINMLAAVALVSLMGCSNPATELAKASERLAACSLDGKQNCSTQLGSGSLLPTKPSTSFFAVKHDTLFYTNDSITVSTQVATAAECAAFADEAGTASNTRLAVGPLTVKLYGQEYLQGIQKACQGPGPFSMALTVAKNSSQKA